MHTGWKLVSKLSLDFHNYSNFHTFNCSKMMLEILLIFVVAAISFTIVQQSKKSKKLPPGPWGFPVIGHLPFLGKYPPVTFQKWKDIYGPIFSVKLGSFPSVVISDLKLVQQAFKLDAVTGRTNFPLFDQVTESKGVGFVSGPRQVEQRRFSLKALKETGLNKNVMENNMETEIAIFISELKLKCRSMTTSKPQPFQMRHFFEFPIINSIWMAVTGKRFNAESDPELAKCRERFSRFTGDMKGIEKIASFFPWLFNLLTYLGINHAMTGVREAYAYVGEHIQNSRSDYVPGLPKNFTHLYFDKVAETKDPNSSFFQGKEQRETTGDLFVAATEATSSTMDWIMIYVSQCPRAQVKIQNEIDSVLGKRGSDAKSPTLADAPQLPYLAAVIFEVYRLSPVTPMGVYRRTLEDLDFQDYRIPRDTTVISNVYAIHRDPATWVEPDTFNPERFLNENGKLNSAQSKLMLFGCGKRSCIGEGYVKDQIFIVCASFFQHFTVSCTDQLPSLDGIPGIIYVPKPFKLYVTERSL